MTLRGPLLSTATSPYSPSHRCSPCSRTFTMTQGARSEPPAAKSAELAAIEDIINSRQEDIILAINNHQFDVSKPPWSSWASPAFHVDVHLSGPSRFDSLEEYVNWWKGVKSAFADHAQATLIESQTSVKGDFATNFAFYELRGPAHPPHDREIVRQFVSKSVWWRNKNGDWLFEAYGTVEGIDLTRL
ncbi:hypothetical protein CB0940_08332 [Cercospora beticola]|uniref:SnoaL-like domain-containing protein n=2 Tax=Cercospora beticola TaxID=122368 RepID=A0A2G5HPK0_CERBT|nr:hypothetical protein CB0940_08332 [Cercospora beticola]PIA94438.1 hypothetical protein CB0940_08332 [Cercospora beticola]CAK1364672.1 unnamed protein product [Cercospora beticola]